jgi:hypothetical protein
MSSYGSPRHIRSPLLLTQPCCFGRQPFSSLDHLEAGYASL